MRLLGLKVDVDTLEGMRRGVPRLLDWLERRNLKATFFIPAGPDHSGRAMKRLVTQRGYLAKMLRNRAPSTFGFKTALRGVLIPGGRMTAEVELLARIIIAGHEVGVHGWDHASWHNAEARFSWTAARRQVVHAFERMTDALREAAAIAGLEAAPAPVGFAAPGWQADFRTLALQDRLPLRFASDTRGRVPFLPVVDGYRLKLPQIPTTLPCLDELAGGLPPRSADVEAVIEDASRQELAVYTAHAEMEGAGMLDLLDGLVKAAPAALPLGDLLDHWKEPLPALSLVRGTIPGRPGTVSMAAEKH